MFPRRAAATERARRPRRADQLDAPGGAGDTLEARERALAALQERLAAREAALEERAEQLRLALAAARVGTWEWDLRSGRVHWSDEQYRLFGYEPFSIKPSFGFLCRRCVHPDDIARGKAELGAGMREGRGYDIEFRVLWPNGETHWLQSRGGFDFDDSGKPIRMVGVTLDIDRLKQAEQAANQALEKLNTIAEATPGTIFTFRETPSGERTFPYATAHLRDTHGIDPEELARDPSLMFSRIHPDDFDRVRASSDESARTMSMWHCQFRHLHPEKGEVWIEAYSSPLREPDGSITWHGIAHDVTALKRAETEVLMARQRAEAADRAKSEFLANMSHEIRTPMSAIMGYADILSARLQDAEDLQMLETIRSNGRYLIDLVDEILDLSRIEAGKLSLDVGRVSPDKLVLDVQSLLKLRAAQKGLALAVYFDGPVPDTIETDPTRLRQILINLIENAIKFTESGGIDVTVRLHRAVSRLEVEVADTGIGIAPEMQKRLFRPFTQAEPALTRRFGGSGLGLSISRALARLLGGDVTVESRVGEGSVFKVTIATGSLRGVPLRAVIAAAAAPAAARVPARSLSCRVLVVDDRAEMRQLAAHWLEECGAQVELAADGRDALARVAGAAAGGRSFDAILLDMQMPVLDGYAAAAELRKGGFAGPIIALTANAMKDDEEKCLACGCDDYLSKPLDRDVLIETIARHTRRRGRVRRPAPRAPAPQAPRAAARSRVLIVDDSEDVCTMLSLLLESIGFEVASATNARDALAAAGAAPFDAMLLDLGLPEMSGAELMAEIKARSAHPGCRFIGLSGRSLPEAEWRALGFDRYLQKPAQLAALAAALDPGRAV